MSTQHTPGPWIVCIQDDDNSAYTVFQEAQLQDGRIATEDWDHCVATAGLDRPEHEANARLIAAAPDLLSALIEIRAYLSKCPPHAEDITGAKWGRVMDLSGAALNRAEGKS
jgi:hypothetical protein